MVIELEKLRNGGSGVFVEFKTIRTLDYRLTLSRIPAIFARKMP